MTSDTTEDRDDDDDIELPDGQLDLTTAVSDAATNRPMIAVYCCEPSNDDIRDTTRTLLTHARDALGYDLNDERVENLTAGREHHTNGVGYPRSNDQDGAVATYDIENEYPDGIEYLLTVAEQREVTGVVTQSLSEFGGPDSATRTVGRLLDEGATVHLIDDDLKVTPGDDRARRWIAAAGRAARNDDEGDGNELVAEAITADGWTGRPPLGFTVSESGQLRRNDQWEEIRSIVKTHDDGLITEYRASQLLDCSRDAIRNAATKYRDLYRLDEPDINGK
ncbi:hypothetical protein [Natrinema versiforme]|uniref:Resolvase n=1 Tax=Natrinema versiforme TaxID=88724 RepID=A0A4P8WMT7_9EURY|nr:hypothetical protein [Natrinema versiforme]QCS43633.1 hypothetical protein FEJ81_15210 [Natrinema versiforme]